MQARRHPPGRHRRRGARLRPPRGRAGAERRAPGRLSGRPARQRAGHDHQPVLLVGPAGGGHRRRSDRSRLDRRRPGRRDRVDVARSRWAAPRSRSTRRSSSSSRRRTSPWGTRPRTSRASSTSAASSRTPSPSPATRRRSRPGRAATSPPRSCPVKTRVFDGEIWRDVTVDRDEGPARRHLAREAGGAQAGLRSDRHRDGRELVAAQRRRRGRHPHLGATRPRL